MEDILNQLREQLKEFPTYVLEKAIDNIKEDYKEVFEDDGIC